MASFTSTEKDPNTNFLRSQRGVSNNAPSTLVSGLGDSYVNHLKDKGLSEAKSATERLQQEFLSAGETFGGGGGGNDGDPSVAVVTKYAEEGGDGQSVSALSQFGEKINRLKKVSESTGGERQYALRAEALLKSQINKMPGLANEFRQIASGILGTGGALVKEKIAVEKEARATAKEQIKEFNTDAKSLGLMPHEISTKQGQIKYLRRAAVRDKIFKLNQQLALNKAMGIEESLDKFELADRDAKYQTDLTTIEEKKAKRKAGFVDADVIKTQRLNTVPAYAQRNRGNASQILMASFKRLGGQGDSIPSEWTSTLPPEERKHIQSQIQSAIDAEKQAMATDGSMTDFNPSEYARIEAIRLAPYTQAMTALNSEQDYKNYDNARKIEEIKIDNKVKETLPFGKMLSSFARLKIPVPDRELRAMQAAGVDLNNGFFDTIIPHYNKAGVSTGAKIQGGISPDELEKAEAQATFAFLTKMSQNVLDANLDDPEATKYLTGMWQNVAQIYSPESGVLMKKGALDSLVDVLADSKNSGVLEAIVNADPMVRSALTKSLQRHSVGLVQVASETSRTFLHQGLVKEEFLGGIVSKETRGTQFIEPVLKNGVFSFQLKEGADKNNPKIREAMATLDSITRDANKSFSALKNMGVEEQATFDLMMKGSMWDKTKKKVTEEVKAKFSKIESNDNQNTNRKGSKYFGKYQMDRQAVEDAGGDWDKLIAEDKATKGIKGAPTPYQDSLLEKGMAKRVKRMEKKGIPITGANMYLAHQQGVKGFSEVYKVANEGGKLSATRKANAKANGAKGSSDQELAQSLISIFTKKYEDS